MNFKKTALATAVGATLAISGVAQVAQADGHNVQLYGRINNAIDIKSRDLAGGGDADATNVETIGSRLGIKASAPINADLTAFGRYEFSTTTDAEETGFGDTRIGEVGVRGDDFGTLKIGNMWSTFYNVVGTHMDPTVTLGSILYSAGIELPYRVSNAIQYSNSFGAVSISAEIRISDEDNPDDTNAEKIGSSDGTALGVSFNATDELLLAFAVDQSSDDPLAAGEDVDRTGFAVKYSMDMWWASFSWGETDIDGDAGAQTQLYVGASFGDGLNGFLGYGILDIDDVDDDPTALTMNVTKRIGNSGFRVYYEGSILSDSDEWYGYEQDRHLLGARIDF